MDTTTKTKQTSPAQAELTPEMKKKLDKLRKPWVIIKMFFQMPVLLLLAKLTEGLIRLTKDGKTRIFKRHHFEIEKELEANWEVMRQELDGLLENFEGIPRFRQIHHSLTVVENWKSHMFYGYGHRMDENCAACPETAKVIDNIPHINTAMFSILYPHTHIPPHTGIYNGVLRYHLGLKVPSPQGSCRFRVEKETIEWKEGEGFVFDNRYEHEAWNDADEIRVVLFLDFMRPLPKFIHFLNKMVVNKIAKIKFVKEARQNLDQFYAKNKTV